NSRTERDFALRRSAYEGTLTSAMVPSLIATSSRGLKTPSSYFAVIVMVSLTEPCAQLPSPAPGSVSWYHQSLIGIPPFSLHKSQGVYFLVEAPAFMRGKKRFSAPGKVSALTMRFSAGPGKSRGSSQFKEWRLFRWTKVQLPPTEAGGFHQQYL